VVGMILHIKVCILTPKRRLSFSSGMLRILSFVILSYLFLIYFVGLFLGYLIGRLKP
jgi:hypothetical protein